MTLNVRLHVLQLRTLLFLHGKLALVVAEVLAAKEKGKLWVVLLLFLGHFLKLRAVPRHKLGQLVDDILQFLICTQQGGGGKSDSRHSHLK